MVPVRIFPNHDQKNFPIFTKYIAGTLTVFNSLSSSIETSHVFLDFVDRNLVLPYSDSCF